VTDAIAGRIPSSLTTVLAAFLAACSAPALLGCTGAADAQGGAPPAPAVSVAPAVQRTLNDTEEFSGRLEAVDFVDLRPRVAGLIDRVHFKDGAIVRKGELLFTIDPKPFRAEVARAEAALASAQARKELAKSELDRADLLAAAQAASKEEVERLASVSRTSAAELQAAEAALRIARLNLGYTQVRAPIAGRISRAAVREGNLVNEQSLLTSIAGVSRIYAYFDASEQSFLRLKAPGATNWPPRVRMRLANESDFAHDGELDFIDNRLNPQTGAIRLRAAFDNTKGDFTPGLAVRVRLQAPATYQAVLVPERAIGTDQSRKFVYVVDGDGKAQYREVMPGSLFDTMRALRSGVKPGEQVVVDGLQRVMPGTTVSPQVLKIDADGVPLAPAPPGPASSASGARG
jgi:multidrug efflux system membrane fusion protein